MGAIDAVPTPATRQFLPAVEQRDWGTALAVLDEHWIEIWYAVDPADLRQLLSQAPPHLLSTRRNTTYIGRVAGHGAVEDLVEPEQEFDRRATPDEVGQLIADLRLRGRPVRAMSYVRKVQQLMRASWGQLVDASGGAAALWLVQVANTALLAGDVNSAKGMLLTGTATRRPDRFPFAPRDVAAKLALSHAVSGDVTEAALAAERARELPRTESWVESMIDDTLWLTDYICAVDTLDPRAEQMRQANPSPMSHAEFWPVALTAHVRHLVLTGRSRQAEQLCEAVAAAGLPPPGADGLFATALPEARASISLHGVQPSRLDEATSQLPAAVVARALHLFTTGQPPAVVQLELPATPYDDRHRRALTLLQAQAAIAKGRAAEGRHLLVQTLREALACGTYSDLRYLTRETLAAAADTQDGARALALVERSAMPTVEVRVTLSAPLTEAEIDVLRLLREGLSRGEIAERLFLSVNTVKTQLSSAYRKFGVTRRVEALEKITLLGL